MDIKTVNDETLIKYAHSFGAEARANQRQYISADDRYDLAVYHGVRKWSEMSSELRDKLICAFNAGVKAEWVHYE